MKSRIVLSFGWLVLLWFVICWLSGVFFWEGVVCVLFVFYLEVAKLLLLEKTFDNRGNYCND